MYEEILKKLDNIEDMIFTLLNEEDKQKINDKKIKELRIKIKVDEEKIKKIERSDK